MKQNIFKPKNILMILLGNTIMALGIATFVLPNGLMTGGTTGLGLIADHFLHLPISTFVFVFNAIMFTLGALIIGWGICTDNADQFILLPDYSRYFSKNTFSCGIYIRPAFICYFCRPDDRSIHRHRHPRRCLHRRYGYSAFNLK